MTSETRRIFQAMTRVERQLYRAIGGTFPHGIPLTAPVWKEPGAQEVFPAQGGGSRPKVMYEVDGVEVRGARAAAKIVGCRINLIESVRDERVINNIRVRRLTRVGKMKWAA